jgi:hypothetical protein
MTGVLRLSLQYFTLTRPQRWLLVPLGVAVCAISVFHYMQTGRSSRAMTFGLIALQLGGIAMAAVAVRALSTSRSLGLVPRFRLKMLASLLLVPALVALTWHASAPVWLSAARVVTASPGTTLVAPFAVASALVLGIAIGARSTTAAFLIFTAFVALLGWMRTGGASAALATAGLDPVIAAAGASVVAWLGFSAWYLTTPDPAGDWFRPTGFTRTVTPDETARMTPSSAAASFLTGMPVATGRWTHPLLWAPVAGLVLTSGLWLIRRWMSPAAVLQFTGMFIVWAVGQIVLEARRSRLLWLTHGSRADIFRLCERRALGYSALLTGALAIVVAFAAGVPSTRLAERVSAVGLPDALWAIVAGGATLCAAAYFALMRVRAWSESDVVLGCLIVAAAVTPTVIIEGAATGSPLVAGLLAADILMAMTCRAIAKRRWERIDWTRLRSSTRWLMRLSPRAHYGR